MGVVLDFLTVSHGIEEKRLALAKRTKPLPLYKLRRLFQKHGTFEPHYPIGFKAWWQTCNLMELAALEHTLHAEPKVVRAIYRRAAEQWLPIVGAMDFKPRIYEIKLKDSPRLARNLQDAFHAKVTKVGRDYHVKYKARPQPLSDEVMQEALICAANSNDPALAKKLARSYKVNALDPMSGDDRYVVLRHLLAEDDRAAAEAAKRLRPGYPADWPPELIEFPLGVVKQDATLLANGLHKLNTRFRGMWDQSRWRAKYEKLISGPRPRYLRSWDDCLKEVRGFLIRMKWLLSPYALAYLNVAAWRGMKSPFDQANLFSEWVPLSLCSRSN